MKGFITGMLLLIVGTLGAQYSTDWIRPSDNYNKSGVMMARDNADNVIVSGFLVANNIYTRKYDKFGNQIWANSSSSGIAGKYEKPYWVNTDSSGNVFVVGCRYSISNFHYPDALVVLKYDPAGALLWKDTIPMTIFVNNVISFNIRSETDVFGNLYIGTVAANPSGFVFMKLDPAGNILFTRSNNDNGVSMFRSMRLKGNRVVFSGSSGNLSLAPAISWDTSGTFLWSAAFLGQSGNDIEMDDSGNTYLLTSYANQVNGSSGQDIKLYKLDGSGSQVWVQNFDFGGYEYPTRFTLVGGRISTICYGNIGGSLFDWITFQTDLNGFLIWSTRHNETIYNDEVPYFVAAKANGDIFVTGKGGPDHNFLGNHYLRMITLKYDNTGTRKWVDSVNIYNGFGMACTLATDGSLFALSDAYTTAFHFFDHDGSALPPVPGGLTVTNITDTSAMFLWTPVSNTLVYHLRYKEQSQSTWTVRSINTSSLAVTGLTPATTYDFACEAVGNGGPSGYTATQSFSTLTAILPIRGIWLEAIRQGNDVRLNWHTETELNSDHFVVEKSLDGRLYQPIGQVNASGNSSSTRYYGFIDQNAAERVLFYRLRLVDADASYTFSPVRMVFKSGTAFSDLRVFPNPASGQIRIALGQALTVQSNVLLINNLGQRVRQLVLASGEQIAEMNIQGLPAGTYTLLVTGGSVNRSQRLIIR